MPMTRRGDLLVSGVLLLAGQVSVWVMGAADRSWAASLTLAASAVVLLARRQAPLRVAWATVGLQALCAAWVTPDSPVFGVIALVAWYAVGRWANPRGGLISVVVVSVLYVPATSDQGSALDWINLYLSIVLTSFVVPWLVGRLVRSRDDARYRRETTIAVLEPADAVLVAENDPTSDRPELAVLSPREREVFDLLARGATNSEIAAELFLSVYTVKAHVASILAKLGLRDRVAVVVFAHAPHELR
jgi:DNA-binding CsgD family transcriptional regulator